MDLEPDNLQPIIIPYNKELNINENNITKIKKFQMNFKKF